MNAGRIAVAAVIALAVFAQTPAVAAGGGNPTIQSPLRSGAKPGCRWVQAPARTSRICDSKTGACRTQTVPAQRIWACGQVRD